MGTTPSNTRPKEDTINGSSGGFFSNIWLCGGADAIDEDATERMRQRIASADKDTNRNMPRSRADDATRVTESADLRCAMHSTRNSHTSTTHTQFPPESIGAPDTRLRRRSPHIGAELLAQEFKTTMRQRGFAAFKYNRNGRCAQRLCHAWYCFDNTPAGQRPASSCSTTQRP